MALGSRRTSPLYRHGNDHLADCRAILGARLTTGPINESDQVQLLGNPHQSADITDPLGADSANQTQIRDRRRIGRAQNGLSCERTLPDWIPHRLGRDAIPFATDYPLEYIHFFHLATSERWCQAKPALLKAIEGAYGPANPPDLRKSG